MIAIFTNNKVSLLSEDVVSEQEWPAECASVATDGSATANTLFVNVHHDAGNESGEDRIWRITSEIARG